MCNSVISCANNIFCLNKAILNIFSFKFAVNERGVFQFGNLTIFEDNGFTVNETFEDPAVDVYYNCYNKSRWNFKLYDSTTDTAKNTWFRAPGYSKNYSS